MDRRPATTAWLLIVILAFPVAVTSYNVLFLLSLGSRSHKNGLDPIAEELGKRGHQVTFFSGLTEKASPVGVNNVAMTVAKELQMKSANFSFFSGQMGNLFSLTTMEFMHSTICLLLNESYSDPFVQDLILHPRVSINGSSKTSPRYDVVVLNALFNDFNLPLAHHLGAPIVYVSPAILPFTVAWSMNIPRPGTYIPNPMMFVDGAMSFWERVVTVVVNFVFVTLRSRYQLPSFDEHVRKFLPDAPSISDIEKNVSFVLSNEHVSLNPSAPSMPYHANVGGIHCKPAKKLPKDLEDFMQSSGDNGVIYFAFGSVQKGTSVPEDMKKKFMKVFSELPQKILWKHETDLEDLPSNVKLIAWAPQQDILGHPKVRLFISHGGGLSIQETSYHGKPVLAFPLGAEQHSNVGNVVRLGFGEHLDWRTFSTEDLREKIKMLLEDPKYTENAQIVSGRFLDRPQRPAEEAAYWIEYVVRHDGAHHLRSGAEDLNFFQYFALDVVAAIVVAVSIAVAIISFLAVVVVRKFITCCPSHKRNNNKQPKEASLNKDKLKKN